MMAFNNNIVV